MGSSDSIQHSGDFVCLQDTPACVASLLVLPFEHFWIDSHELNWKAKYPVIPIGDWELRPQWT